jgi:hypothetical protein
MAKGFNWGIFSLLGIVAVVLGGISCFFVYLGKRSATLTAAAADQSGLLAPRAPVTGHSSDPSPQ